MRVPLGPSESSQASPSPALFVGSGSSARQTTEMTERHCMRVVHGLILIGAMYVCQAKSELSPLSRKQVVLKT